MALDTVGYSRLKAADEEGTHARLKAHRGELLDPAFARCQGHVIKNTGDGLLAEFPSAVDCVACSVEIQRRMAGVTKTWFQTGAWIFVSVSTSATS